MNKVGIAVGAEPEHRQVLGPAVGEQNGVMDEAACRDAVDRCCAAISKLQIKSHETRHICPIRTVSRAAAIRLRYYSLLLVHEASLLDPGWKATNLVSTSYF